MTKACCVPFCSNRQYSHKPKNASLTFHEIPSKDPQRTEWITGIAKVYLELLNQPNWEPGERAVVCSDHFEKICFRPNLSFKVLYSSAFPSLFNQLQPKKNTDRLTALKIKKFRNKKPSQKITIPVPPPVISTDVRTNDACQASGVSSLQTPEADHSNGNIDFDDDVEVTSPIRLEVEEEGPSATSQPQPKILKLDYPPKSYQFCIVCNTSDIKVSRTYWSTNERKNLRVFYSTILKFQISKFHPDFGDFPFCTNCEDLLTQLYKLNESIQLYQMKFEVQKEEFVKKIMDAYCQRKAAEKSNDNWKNFCTSGIPADELLKAWKSHRVEKFSNAETQTENYVLESEIMFDTDMQELNYGYDTQETDDYKPDLLDYSQDSNSIILEKENSIIAPDPSNNGFASSKLIPDFKKKYRTNVKRKRIRIKRKHQCTICGLLVSANYLAKHMRNIHTEPTKKAAAAPKQKLERPVIGKSQCSGREGFVPLQKASSYSCVLESCTKYFLNKKALKRHLCSKVHKTETNHQSVFWYSKCDYQECSMAFYNRDRHMQDIHKFDDTQLIPAFTCTTCMKVFSTNENLTKHVEAIHDSSTSIKKVYDCKYCLEYFCDEEVLELHKDEHKIEISSVERYLCHICGKVFASCQGLTMHKTIAKCGSTTTEKVKPKKNQQKYTCEVCKKVFNHKGNLVEHSYTHKPGGFDCNICGFVCKTPGRLYTHKRFTHSGTATWSSYYRSRSKRKCNYCGIEYCPTEQIALNRHFVQAHADIHEPELKFHCSICFLKFGTHKEMESHRIETHKPCYCQVCGKEFSTKKKLKSHKVKHTNSFPCEHCGKIFHVPCNYREHINRHLGVRPIQCNLCGSGFFRKREIVTHFQKMHPGQDYNENLSRNDQTTAAGSAPDNKSNPSSSGTSFLNETNDNDKETYQPNGTLQFTQ